MLTTEPIPTALLLLAFGALMGISILFSRASERSGIPVVLIFLLVGMVAGAERIGGIAFADYQLAFRLGTIALVLILFDGGLNTPLQSLRLAARPASVLATVGVAATALLVAFAAHLFGFSREEALLLGAVVSSTDAAAVFSVLRNSGTQLKRRVGVTLELESGLNDPVAFILTMLLATHFVHPRSGVAWRIPLEVALNIAVGGATGVAVGVAGRALLRRVRLRASGLYPALTLALALIAFGAPVLLRGSGFLSVYVAAVIIGNSRLPYRGNLLRVHDAIAWLGQIAMFLVLGLLAVPSELARVGWFGLAIGLFLGVVARPAVVFLCLLPFGYTVRDMMYVGWVGLRGAVPIVLATFPVLVGAPGAARVFNVVFFVVVVNALVQGGTVRWVTRALGLESADPPPPHAVLEISSMRPLRNDIMSFYVDRAVAACGVAIAELPFPPDAAATLIVRGEELLAPRGGTVLQAGDHVYVFCRPEDRPFLQLIFGRPQDD